MLLAAKVALVLLLAGLLAAIGVRLVLAPSHDRVWVAGQTMLPDVEIRDSLVAIRNLRNYRYPSADEHVAGYEQRSFDLRRLERVWFVLSPFSRDWRGPAHSFLSFEFADSQFVSISVEARREVGESYSIWKGMLRQFELMYVIGDERDLIGLRAFARGDEVYLYPIRATPEQARSLFLFMLERAQELAQRPEFYDTLTNNCTTNILDAVNRVATRRIPYGVAIFLPGYSDKLAYERGLIDTDLSLEEARRRFRVDPGSADVNAADFSLRIRG